MPSHRTEKLIILLRFLCLENKHFVFPSFTEKLKKQKDDELFRSSFCCFFGMIISDDDKIFFTSVICQNQLDFANNGKA